MIPVDSLAGFEDFVVDFPLAAAFASLSWSLLAFDAESGAIFLSIEWPTERRIEEFQMLLSQSKIEANDIR